MIQRIQTLFLFLVLALGVALFFFPVFVVKTTAGSVVHQVPYMIEGSRLTCIVVALSGLIALISIFLYKDRRKQLLLCRLNLLFIIAAVGLILQASDPSSMTKTAVTVTVEYCFAVCFAPLQIIFNLLAWRYIKKDDELVRSAERLR
jgi:hypothetical protein